MERTGKAGTVLNGNRCPRRECLNFRSSSAQVLGLGMLASYLRDGMGHMPAPQLQANHPPCKILVSRLDKRPLQFSRRLGCYLLCTAREVLEERFQMRMVAAARIPTKRESEEKVQRQRGGISLLFVFLARFQIIHDLHHIFKRP